MEDKREISLKRAKELHNEIADYLEFKEQYIRINSLDYEW